MHIQTIVNLAHEIFPGGHPGKDMIVNTPSGYFQVWEDEEEIRFVAHKRIRARIQMIDLAFLGKPGWFGFRTDDLGNARIGSSLWAQRAAMRREALYKASPVTRGPNWTRIHE